MPNMLFTITFSFKHRTNNPVKDQNDVREKRIKLKKWVERKSINVKEMDRKSRKELRHLTWPNAYSSFTSFLSLSRMVISGVLVYRLFEGRADSLNIAFAQVSLECRKWEYKKTKLTPRKSDLSYLQSNKKRTVFFDNSFTEEIVS